MKCHYILFLISVIMGCAHPLSEEMKVNYGTTTHLFSSEDEEDNEIIIPMKRTMGGSYMVTIEVNDVPMDFVFDTGADAISISSSVADQFIRQGTLSREDFLGMGRFTDATGGVTKGAIINLRKVKIGDHILRNVVASVVNNSKAPLLLGQSALQQFGNIEIDNDKHCIILKK